ncbi:hypothetical protein SDC9_137601 [bioreactor metagenome]|uniref:Uncharacterized protein n=1 Tax=bioreactor metagenome TaxID=1076179 RepID=A0A645DM02_9ZZZZ
MEDHAAVAPRGQHTGDQVGQLQVGHANCLRLRASGIGQRTQEVEGGLDAQFLAHRSGVPQRGVVQRGEQENQAAFVKDAALALRGHVQCHTERL